MGKKGRNSGSSPSPSSLTKSKKHSGTSSRLYDYFPKYPTVQNSSRSKDDLTLGEMRVAVASKASRLNAKANEGAINDAVGVVLSTCASNESVSVINASSTKVLKESDVGGDIVLNEAKFSSNNLQSEEKKSNSVPVHKSITKGPENVNAGLLIPTGEDSSHVLSRIF